MQPWREERKKERKRGVEPFCTEQLSPFVGLMERRRRRVKGKGSGTSDVSFLLDRGKHKKEKRMGARGGGADMRTE